ncbi:MAG: DUF3179 domain-containing protein [Myxococcales bacterium]|nr:DUF3179 domain-containing protein [Myxococcales bacterium]
MGLIPSIDDRPLHLSAGGLYNGMVLLVDDETKTYWDHISGVGVHGEQTGQRLRRFPIRHTTTRAALARYPSLEVVLSEPGVLAKMYGLFFSRRLVGTKGFFPPGFRGTMGELDDRLPDRIQGLGVVVDQEACFYPAEHLHRPATVELGGRRLRVARGEDDDVPSAEPLDGKERPFQLYTRWYGFSFTFPGCAIYQPRA